MKQTRYVTILTVFVPGADALIDMLRYDACYPRTEGDAHKIIRLMNGTDDADDHIIELVRASVADVPHNEGRWNSFGCRVLDIRHPETSPLAMDALRKRVADRSRLSVRVRVS